MILRRLFHAATLVAAICCSIGPAIAAPDLEIYGRLPGFEMAAISPSGDRIAIVGVVGDERSLLVTDRSGKLITRAPLGDAKIRSVDWAGENRLLLKAGKTVPLGVGFTADKTELSGMIVIPLDGGKPWSIFDGIRNVTGGIRGYHGAVERDGRWYGYFGGITMQQGYITTGKADLYRVDLDNGKALLIARHIDAGSRDWIVAPDGTVAATLDFMSSSGSWEIHNADHKLIASGRARTGDIDLIGLGPTPGSILYSTSDEDGHGRLFALPLSGGAASEILADQPVNSYHIHPRGRQLIGYVREGDIPEDHFFDRSLDKKMAAVRRAFPGVSVSLVDANDAFDRLIVRTSGPGDPQSWWTVDIKSGTASPLGASYTLASASVGPMRMVRYKAADGLDIAGVLTLPPDRPAKNLPVIVLPHRGSGGRDYPVFNWWAQAFASRGYAVLQPNFRGSTGLSTDFERAGHGEWGRKMQSDISDGLAAIVREGIVDAKRACIVGASYGGYAALAGVTLQQGLYRCAAAVAGVADVYRMSTTEARESDWDPTVIRFLREQIGSGRDLKQISPISFAGRADAPILLVHGVEDVVVPFEQSQAMAAALNRAGKPVELVKLVGEDHWLSRSETRLAMLKAVMAFVERHNPPDAAPAPPHDQALAAGGQPVRPH